MSQTDEELAVLQAQGNPAPILYKRKIEVVEARQVTDPEEHAGYCMTGPYIARRGEWIVVTPGGNMVYSDKQFGARYEPLLLSWWEGLWKIWELILATDRFVPWVALELVNRRLHKIHETATEVGAVDSPTITTARWWCCEAKPWEQFRAVAMLLKLEAIPPAEREAALRRGEIFT